MNKNLLYLPILFFLISGCSNNVLDYAAIERNSKHYILRPNDINETIQRVVDSLQATLSMRNVDIFLDLDYALPLLKHDPDAISQCVINLLSNAAKYSGTEKKIVVKSQKNETGCHISVSDNGIGISQEDQQKIFEPFFRSREESARRRKGTGIGLAITLHIMEAHGGAVEVHSSLGEGSTFTLRFPVDLIITEGGES